MHSLPNIIKAIELMLMSSAGHVAHMEWEWIRGFGRKPAGKRPLVRPRYIWEVNVEMGLRETESTVLTGFIFLRIEINGRLLWTW
jgi:hypothetical protein